MCVKSIFNLLSGLPQIPPNITAVTPLNDTSFTVNWTIPDPSYNYTVMWTNLYSGVVDSVTVLEDTNSYAVTGLNEYDNYNVSIAVVGLCGMMTSNPITVYGMYLHKCMYAIQVRYGVLAYQRIILFA